MKKKVMATLCIALIAVMCVSLFACNQGMFDGSFKKEATSEEAKAAWDSACEAMGVSNAETMALASDEDEVIKGWKGIAFELSMENSAAASADDSKAKTTLNLTASGSVLFDMSGFGVSAGINGSVQDKAVDAKIGAYMENNVYYADMSFNDAVLQAQADANGSVLDVANELLGGMVSSLSQSLASVGMTYTAGILSAVPYEELADLGVKAYINTSGDYNRVKFEFPAEFFARMQGASDTEAYLETMANASISLIVATEKETNMFSGAKLDMDYAFKADTNNANAGASSKLSVSMSNATEVTNYPKGKEDFKSVKDMTINDLETFFENMMDSLEALMQF